MNQDQRAVLERSFTLKQTNDWTTLVSPDERVRWLSRVGRLGKVQDGHLYFTLGETKRGKACLPHPLTERLRQVIARRGLAPRTLRSTDTPEGTPQAEGKYFVGFSLEDVTPDVLEAIVEEAMEEVAACADSVVDAPDTPAATAVVVDLADPEPTPRLPSFDEERFRDAHDEFLAFIRSRDDADTSFDELPRPFEQHPFFLESEIDYKEAARSFAYTVLPAPGEWHTWLGDTGRLLGGLYEASFKTTNLLVLEYGDADNSASPVYLTLNGSREEQAALERALALLFDGPTEPEAFGPRFDRLADFIRENRLGCKWDFLAYLAFLVDHTRYFPVKSSHFQHLLRYYGSDEPFAGHVTWERYQTLMRLAAWIREMLPERYGTPTALELQSYMWVVIYGVLPRVVDALAKKARRLRQEDFDKEARRRAARAADAHDVGLEGERYCYEREVARLREAGREDLAGDVRLFSMEDDGAGYDLLTFHEDGSERRVEIKTTSWSESSGRCFWLSQNEHLRAERDPSWELWRVWDVRGKCRVEELGNIVMDVPDGWEQEVASWRYSRPPAQ